MEPSTIADTSQSREFSVDKLYMENTLLRVDGRHAVGVKSCILQAKHYVGSTLAALKYAMKRERLAVDRLPQKPRRYILATSRPITPNNNAVLAEIIGPVL